MMGLSLLGEACLCMNFVPSEDYCARSLSVEDILIFSVFIFLLLATLLPRQKMKSHREGFPAFIRISSVLASSLLLLFRLVLQFEQ